MSSPFFHSSLSCKVSSSSLHSSLSSEVSSPSLHPSLSSSIISFSSFCSSCYMSSFFSSLHFIISSRFFLLRKLCKLFLSSRWFFDKFAKKCVKFTACPGIVNIPLCDVRITELWNFIEFQFLFICFPRRVLERPI